MTDTTTPQAGVTPSSQNPDPKRRGWAAVRCGIAGALAALICALTCCAATILATLGAGASTAAGMADMGQPGNEPRGTLGVLLHHLQRISPALLIVSIVLIGVAFALRRPAAVVPALLAGAVLYASVHAQSDPVVMYSGMSVGYATWIGLYLWTRSHRPRPTCARTD